MYEIKYSLVAFFSSHQTTNISKKRIAFPPVLDNVNALFFKDLQVFFL
ncbi:hypothetical protein B14911_22227 [Bacillus sp. NRRL B-14911]|nr:hypothetical protein B14911_22227 [Bacillus sp. NRRL B-14911]